MPSKSQMKTIALTVVVLAALNRVGTTKQLINGDSGGWFG